MALKSLIFHGPGTPKALLSLERRSVNIKGVALECVVTVLTGFKPGIPLIINQVLTGTVAPALEKCFQEGKYDVQTAERCGSVFLGR